MYGVCVLLFVNWLKVGFDVVYNCGAIAYALCLLVRTLVHVCVCVVHVCVLVFRLR